MGLSTNPACSVVFEDGDGVLFDLTTRLISFERIKLREVKYAAVVIKNRSGSVVKNVVADTTAHPTAQLGSASETYNATELSLEKYGTYGRPLTIGDMAIDESKLAWLRWSMPEKAIPGYGQFAIRVTGDVVY